MLMHLRIITLKTIKVITPAPKSHHLTSNQDKMNKALAFVLLGALCGKFYLTVIFEHCVNLVSSGIKITVLAHMFYNF